MAGSTLELTEDQVRVSDRLHGFAADVIRPTAAQWDEREETPWPALQETAELGRGRGQDTRIPGGAYGQGQRAPHLFEGASEIQRLVMAVRCPG